MRLCNAREEAQAGVRGHETKYCRRRREESLISCLSQNNETPHVVSYSFMNWPWLQGVHLVRTTTAAASFHKRLTLLGLGLSV